MFSFCAKTQLFSLRLLNHTATPRCLWSTKVLFPFPVHKQLPFSTSAQIHVRTPATFGKRFQIVKKITKQQQ